MRSALVGRGDALATLREVVARAIDFQAPQLVTIVGNQGTGKTRLINELIVELTSADHGPRANAIDAKPRVFHGARASAIATGKLVRLAAIASLLRDRFELTPNPDEPRGCGSRTRSRP